MTLTIQELQHSLIDPDPRNPRQIFDEAQLLELANDISARGIDTPITVRKHPTEKSRYMIVFGERRWRAASMIGLAVIPAIVREMNDMAALEAQVAENSKRADVHPLEEADAYRRLHEEHGRDIEELCELQGKTRAYIYAAMKLCALAAEPRKAFLAGKLDKSRALLIARLPASVQTKASQAIGAEWSYRQVQQYLRQNFMLRLDDAPFVFADASLVPKAGACGPCDKRTGNQQEMYPDVTEEKGGLYVCTDGACYKAKCDAHWARLKNEAAARGRVVLEGEEAARVGLGGRADKKHIDLDAAAIDLGEYNKSWRDVLGKHGESAVSAIARDPRDGEIKELISRSDLPRLMKEAGVKTRKEPVTKDSTIGEAIEERKRLEKLVTGCVRDTIMVKAADLEQLALWRMLARMAIRVSCNDAHRQVLKLHGIQVVQDYTPKATLLVLAGDEKTVEDLRSLTIDLMLAETHGWQEGDDEEQPDPLGHDDEYRSNLADAAQLLGVDVPAIVAKVKQDMAAATAGKGKKTGPATATDVQVPGITALISMPTEDIYSLYKRVFGVETKRNREWVQRRLEKRHAEQNPISEHAKAMFAKSAEAQS
jgi:ParB/RepB/Spo0J family partition protein